MSIGFDNNQMHNETKLIGWVRDITDTGFFLQQTNNTNLNLFIRFGESSQRAQVVEFSPVAVSARVIGEPKVNEFRDCKVERNLVIIAVSIDDNLAMGSEIDAASDDSWNLILPEGVVSDGFRPKNLPIRSADGDVDVVNQVSLAGFVSNFYLGGKAHDPVLMMQIAQCENNNSGIPVRVYGSRVKPLMKIMQRGMPVLVEGRCQIKVSVIDEAGYLENGAAVVSKLAYVHASDLLIPTREHIKATPEWAVKMFVGLA